MVTTTMLMGTNASAQDLFELEVFESAVTPPGRYDVELHTNVMSRGGVTPDSLAGNHRPAHVSVEVTRGWTNRFESAIFIQTAPFGSPGSARFAGGHLRTKIRIGELSVLPLRVAMSAEYAFNRTAFDLERQTLELRTILDYARGRLSVIANPSLEVVTRGPDEGLEPVFDISARAAWELAGPVTLTSDYFSAAATTPTPPTGAKRAPSAVRRGGRGSRIGVGSEHQRGHCVTSGEPWLMKSVLGFKF